MPPPTVQVLSFPRVMPLANFFHADSSPISFLPPKDTMASGTRSFLSLNGPWRSEDIYWKVPFNQSLSILTVRTLHNAHCLNDHQAWWSLFFAQFKLVFNYLPRTKKADACAFALLTPKISQRKDPSLSLKPSYWHPPIGARLLEEPSSFLRCNANCCNGLLNSLLAILAPERP